MWPTFGIDNGRRWALHGEVKLRFPAATALFLLSATLCRADEGGVSAENARLEPKPVEASGSAGEQKKATEVAVPTDKTPWAVIEQNRGITVSRRVQPGCSLPSFRGQGRIKGDVLQILSVMLDLGAVGAWAHGVDTSRPIKRIDGRTHLIYLTSDLPWPVRDRDMIVRSEVDVIRPAEEFRISLRCQPDAQAEQPGVIRVRQCLSTLHLRKIDQNTTEIDYVMTLDPAGYLPRWATEWVSKATPFKTLVAIEERAAASKGEYAASVRSWSTAM